MVDAPIKTPNRAQLDRITGGDQQATRLLEDLFRLAGISLPAEFVTAQGDIVALQISLTATIAALDDKQDTLVSGTNIKTVNGTSLLGSGDVVISGGGSSPIISWIY